MAVKTFTTGEVLTASDTNTYLANSGLVYITSTTIGTTVSSVTVNNCFSSTYDNYRILVNGGLGNQSQAITMQLGASTTGYYNALTYVVYATAAFLSATTNNGASWNWFGESNANCNVVCADVINPYAAKYTSYSGSYPGTVGGFTVGYHGVAASYTGFTLAVAGTMTGGTITVYGYRKA